MLVVLAVFVAYFFTTNQKQQIKIPWELGKIYKFSSVTHGKKSGSERLTVKSFEDGVYTIEIVRKGGFPSTTTYKISQYGEPVRYDVQSDLYQAVTTTFTPQKITFAYTSEGKQQSQTIDRHKNLLLFDSITIIPSLNLVPQQQDKVATVHVHSIAMNVPQAQLKCLGQEEIDYNGKQVKCWKYILDLSDFGHEKLWFDENGFFLRRQTDIFTLEWVQNEQHEKSLEDPAVYDAHFPPVEFKGSLDLYIIDEEFQEKEKSKWESTRKEAGKVLEDYQQQLAQQGYIWFQDKSGEWFVVRSDEKIVFSDNNSEFRWDKMNGMLQHTITDTKVSEQFEAFTKKHKRKQVAMIKKDRILLSLRIEEPIYGNSVLRGVTPEDLQSE